MWSTERFDRSLGRYIPSSDRLCNAPKRIKMCEMYASNTRQ